MDGEGAALVVMYQAASERPRWRRRVEGGEAAEEPSHLGCGAQK
jgi:hypothetical protein